MISETPMFRSMKTFAPFRSVIAGFLVVCAGGASGLEPQLTIERGFELSWPTTLGNRYQLQSSPQAGGAWNPLGEEISGDGTTRSRYEPASSGPRLYQVLETVPGTDPVPPVPVNGGFETGSGGGADHWTTAASQPPARSNVDAHSGTFSMRGSIVNVGNAAGEGLLSHRVVAAGGSILPGQSHGFSFWIKQISSGPSYVQQYELQWLNASNGVIGGSGLQNFNGAIGSWSKISVASVAPAAAVEAVIRFRFVTGAVTGGHGEVLIDDVELDSGTAAGPGTPDVITARPVAKQAVAKISWPSVTGEVYQPVSSVDLAKWDPVLPSITGDGSTKTFTVPMSHDAEYFRLGIPVAVVLPPSNLHAISSGAANSIGLAWNASATPGVTGYRIYYGLNSGSLDQWIDVGNVTSASVPGLTPGVTYHLSVVALTGNGQSVPGDATISAVPNAVAGIVALYNSSTALEAPTTVVTPAALITRIADRARDRHAREAIFNSYDHYLSWYWEERTISIEIIDRVAKGGTDITFNYTTLTPLGAPEFRAFFRGINTVAEYHGNYSAPLVGPNQYSVTLSSKLPENRPLAIGDRIEIEISQFILAPMHGRNNYYGTTMLYIVGQGIVPWEGVGTLLDSFPLPQSAWLGGLTTLPYQYSNEPEHRFKQTAGNIAPVSAQPFMLGRRLHHTDFGSGAHSEPGNPAFAEHSGKLGPKFIARSCVECHTNNGRALPPAIGAPMLQTVMKVGGDANGTPHSSLGSVLQPGNTGGPAEGGATISGYTDFTGTYGDGAPYSLRKPNYSFQGVTPAFFSARLAPPLVGMGLLEAIGEASIVTLADPNDSNQDGISGRIQQVTDPETGVQRLGRFTAKAGKAKLSHQIAAALNTDMGVTSAVFPLLDGQTTAGPQELAAAELDKMTRYVALLGIGARRDLNDPQAIRGQQVFASAQCVKCHTPDLTTSPFHPLTELRSQTIHPYTDMLLHDMGSGLADNMGEDGAAGSEWRTPPLWGIGLTAGVSGGEAYLHDGRARTLEEAILWHGGEAEASKQSFRSLPAADRAALIKFLKSL